MKMSWKGQDGSINEAMTREEYMREHYDTGEKTKVIQRTPLGSQTSTKGSA